MKNLTLIFFVIFFPIRIFSQKSDSLIYEKRIEMIENDSVHSEGLSYLGMRIGEWKYYYKNNSLLKINIYSIDTAMYPHATYQVKLQIFNKHYQDTTILSYESFASQVDSIHKLISEADFPIVEYSSDRKVRKKIAKFDNLFYYLEFSPNGVLLFKSLIEKGRIGGKHWDYYENGKLKLEAILDKTKRQWNMTSYNADGILKEKYTVKMSKYQN